MEVRLLHGWEKYKEGPYIIATQNLNIDDIDEDIKAVTPKIQQAMVSEEMLNIHKHLFSKNPKTDYYTNLDEEILIEYTTMVP